MATAKRRAKPKTKSAAVAKLSLHDLKPPLGSHRARIRKGRGPGSGIGKTAGRGGKGQTARSGGATRPRLEGGQMPRLPRPPKRGFTNPSKHPAQGGIVPHRSLLVDQEEVTPHNL